MYEDIDKILCIIAKKWKHLMGNVEISCGIVSYIMKFYIEVKGNKLVTYIFNVDNLMHNVE